MAKTLKEHNFFDFDATTVADSRNIFNDRLSTLVITLPRVVLAEFNTHRMFSRNSASSRAIPFRKMVERVKSHPYIPKLWQKDHTGMQGTEYFTDPMEIESRVGTHLKGRDWGVVIAEEMSQKGVTKQIVNRYLEPFLMHTIICTATEWENFLALRCPQFTDPFGNAFKSRTDYLESVTDPDMQPKSLLGWFSINQSAADVHIQLAAEAIHDALNQSTPKLLRQGEWHIPFENDIVLSTDFVKDYQVPGVGLNQTIQDLKVKISTALCARLSYGNITPDSDFEKDIALYDRLKRMKHLSPFEHCAEAMGEDNYHLFFKGEVEDFYYEKLEEGVFYQMELGVDIENEHKFGWCLNFQGFIQERYKLAV